MAKKKQQAKVADQIIGQNENKELIKVSIEMNTPVLLVGETGTGKTSLIRELAKENNKKFIRVNLNGQTSIDEFVGKWLIKNQQTYWQDGVLVQAMKNGDWLLCDEINAALPEILFVLHSLLDDDRSIRLSEKDGDLVEPHKDFRFFATMNPFDEYVGTKELNKAFLSRFTMVLDVHYPKPDDEQQILLNRTKISEGDATILVEFANQARKAKAEEKIYYTCSTRDLLYWASVLEKKIDMKTAFKISILNKANKPDRPKLIEIFDNVTQAISNLLKEYQAQDLPSLLEDIKQMADEVVKEKDNVQKAAEHYKLQKGTLEKEFEDKFKDVQSKYQQKEKAMLDKLKNMEQDALKKALNAIQNQLTGGNSSQQDGEPTEANNGQGTQTGEDFVKELTEASNTTSMVDDFLSQDFDGKQGRVTGDWYDKKEEQVELSELEAQLEELGIKQVAKPEPGTDHAKSLNGAKYAEPQKVDVDFEGAVGNKKIEF